MKAIKERLVKHQEEVESKLDQLRRQVSLVHAR
jgi:hypothetical protein